MNQVQIHLTVVELYNNWLFSTVHIIPYAVFVISLSNGNVALIIPLPNARHSHMSQEIAAEMGYRAELGGNIDCYIENI